jgi:hypothetical protein
VNLLVEILPLPGNLVSTTLGSDVFAHRCCLAAIVCSNLLATGGLRGYTDKET